MEEIERNNNNNAQIRQQKITIKASEIMQKFWSVRDQKAFCKEMSKPKLFNI